jgi:hypothetical protein
MRWLFEKYKGLYGELYKAVYTHYEKKDVKKPERLATTFIVFTLFLCVSVIAALIVVCFVNFENYNTFNQILVPILIALSIFAVPWLGGLIMLYYCSICAITVEFLLSLIPSEKFQKIAPYISFFSGGILGIAVAIWLFLKE